MSKKKCKYFKACGNAENCQRCKGYVGRRKHTKIKKSVQGKKLPAAGT